MPAEKPLEHPGRDELTEAEHRRRAKLQWGPWIWAGPHADELRDAYGNAVAKVFGFHHAPTELAKERIRAAPEMEELLRQLVDLTRDGDQVRDNVGWICNLCDEAAALLARIDAAKGGG